MNPPKKRKIGDECRVFNEEWTNKYFFGDTGNKAVCLLYHETIAVFKEYNLKRHHEPNSEFGCKLSMEERKIKAAECVKRLMKQQTLFTKQLTLQNSATEKCDEVHLSH
jgi:hypothetical protein